jgi:hypothetical protein
MAGQLWLATQDDAPSLRTLAPFSGSGPDQITLKLTTRDPSVSQRIERTSRKLWPVMAAI